jgi:methionine sulfoxide reductase heme-binding subunit
VIADPTFWLIARAAGLAAFGLLTASVLAGLVLTGKPFGRAVKPAVVAELHRMLALLGLGAVGLHGVALVLDRSVDIPLQALVIPGLVPYRPVWTSLGVVAALLMGLLTASWRVRTRIGVANWRRIHKASFVAFLLAAGHGVWAGTDTAQPWALGLYVGALGMVATALAWRILMRPTRAVRPAADRPATSSSSTVRIAA